MHGSKWPINSARIVQGFESNPHRAAHEKGVGAHGVYLATLASGQKVKIKPRHLDINEFLQIKREVAVQPPPKRQAMRIRHQYHRATRGLTGNRDVHALARAVFEEAGRAGNSTQPSSAEATQPGTARISKCRSVCISQTCMLLNRV